MRQHPRVVISSPAYLSMLAETYSFVRSETGGIFLGRVIDSTWYILEVIDPGYDSTTRRQAYFEYDDKYVTHLANVRSRLYRDRLELMGLWHRHPGSFDSFSRTDDETNVRYATLNPKGSISAIVNLDPDFRTTFYLVTLPLKYTRISEVYIGDSHIPANLKELRKAEDFIVDKTHIYEEVHNPKSSGFWSWMREAFSGGQQPQKPREAKLEEAVMMEMLDLELDDYLEQQSDYSYELHMGERALEVRMKYLGDMQYYPSQLTCLFYLQDGRKECSINGQRFAYSPGFIKRFISHRISQHMKKERRTDSPRAEEQDEKYYASVLGLEGDYDFSRVRNAYRSKMKDYHPDFFQNEQNDTLLRAATMETIKIKEAYDFFDRKYNCR